MDLFSPELSQYWLDSLEMNLSADDCGKQTEIKSSEQEAAWTELSDRVRAARNIV